MSSKMKKNKKERSSMVCCNNKDDWDIVLEKYKLVVVCFVTSSSSSIELFHVLKALAVKQQAINVKPEENATIKFVMVDANYFKSLREGNIIVKRVPCLMFVNNGERKFPNCLEFKNAEQLRKQIDLFVKDVENEENRSPCCCCCCCCAVKIFDGCRSFSNLNVEQLRKKIDFLGKLLKEAEASKSH